MKENKKTTYLRRNIGETQEIRGLFRTRMRLGAAICVRGGFEKSVLIGSGGRICLNLYLAYSMIIC